MENVIGGRIGELRERLGLTQDQFGARYGVSGPAVFKFEKGYVKPSLNLWLKVARDCDIPEKKAVLLWIRAKLPQEYQAYIDMSVAEPQVGYDVGGRVAYARITNAHELRAQLSNDPSVPRGLKALVSDEEFWGLYRPTGQEIDLIVEKFGAYANADETLFREALRLVREFLRSQY